MIDTKGNNRYGLFLEISFMKSFKQLKVNSYITPRYFVAYVNVNNITDSAIFEILNL